MKDLNKTKKYDLSKLNEKQLFQVYTESDYWRGFNFFKEELDKFVLVFESSWVFRYRTSDVVDATELFENITRFEYITEEGRQVVEYGSFSFDLQDGGKTLKVFKNGE